MYIGTAGYKLATAILVSLFLINSTNSYAETKTKTTKTVEQIKDKSESSLKVGDTVSGKFVSSFEPEPFVGMRYSFLSTSVGGEYTLPVKEETTEVLSMANGYATLLLSGSNREDAEKLVKVSDIRSSGVIYVQFKYNGLTDVSVPFGKFKKATKVTVSNKSSDLSLWLVKGIGVVKLIEYDKVTKGRIITELRDFRGKKGLFPDRIPNKVY